MLFWEKKKIEERIEVVGSGEGGKMVN